MPVSLLNQRTIAQISVSSLAVLAAMLFATNDVQASCGDYLFAKGVPVNIHHMDNDFHGAVHASSNEIVPSPGQKRPCSGPNCSGRRVPVHGALGNLAVVKFRSDQAAWLEMLTPPPASGSDRTVPASELDAFYEPGSIFRPPIAC